MSGWKYFFPDDGETIEDAREFRARDQIGDSEMAAQIACERDFSEHDGWERSETEFAIAVISPDGDVHRYRAWHEPSVEHRVSEDA